MNKTLVTLAALATLATTGAAQAQSSVTLSGIADAAVRSVSNEGRGSIKSMVSGSNSTSRLVIRGTEDLGGGWSAGFWLEHGIALDTGNPTGGFWDRRSTVSLAGKSVGELRLGRDFVPSYTAWSRYDPFGYVGVAGSNNLVSATPQGPIRSAFGTNPNTTVRSSNSAQWFLPAGLGGVEGVLMVAAGEGGTAAGGQHKLVGGRLGWAGGPVNLSVAHTRTENDLTTAGRFGDTTVGGSWNLGFLRLSAAWREFKQASAQQTNVMAGATVPVGLGEVKISFLQASFGGRVGNTVLDANEATQIGLGYVHHLSKRTAVYTSASRIDNDGALTYAVPSGPTGLAAGRNSTGYEVGVRHNF
jgi:predicted porin